MTYLIPVLHDNTLLCVRYLKLRRGMPQTRWINMATGVRIGGVSLAEYIEAAILPVYGAEVTKFVSGVMAVDE
jgi:tRNA U54 and U55 pseudouridine synthase Pus10